MSTPNHGTSDQPVDDGNGTTNGVHPAGRGSEPTSEVSTGSSGFEHGGPPEPSVPNAVPPKPAMPAAKQNSSQLDDGHPAGAVQADVTSRHSGEGDPAAAESGNGQPNQPPPAPPPWQREPARESASEPQREPQSNLYRPGMPPVTGRPSMGVYGDGTPAQTGRSLSDVAAKAARREAAMVKSVGIDGPTRSIARPELIKDMPDLSELRHPTPAPHDTGPQAAVTGFGAVSPGSTGPLPGVIRDGEPLRTTVQLRRVDPWSTLKVSVVISVVTFFVWMIAVGLLYLVLAGMGVWDRLNNMLGDATGGGGTTIISAGQVFGYAALIGVINIVLLTALATIGSFIFNQCSDVVGGVQITLADPD